ncbi:MAG TPA: hypothetical protein VKT25_15465 [Ktedonobacteraceae bacterium]|nr:hypothetical protein [Ktedonobacteraceae bacterium]
MLFKQPQPNDAMHTCADIHAARKDLGFSPQVSLLVRLHLQTKQQLELLNHHAVVKA